MTSFTYHELNKLVKCDEQERIPSREPLRKQRISPLEISMRCPDMPYKKSVLEEISWDPFVKNGSVAGPSADNRIVEPPQDQSQNNLKKLTELKDITNCP